MGKYKRANAGARHVARERGFIKPEIKALIEHTFGKPEPIRVRERENVLDQQVAMLQIEAQRYYTANRKGPEQSSWYPKAPSRDFGDLSAPSKARSISKKKTGGGKTKETLPTAYVRKGHFTSDSRGWRKLPRES